CLRVTTDFLPDPPSTRIRIGKVDHDITQALGDRGESPVDVPLVGRIAAGAPLLATELVEDVYSLPRQVVGDGDLFALTVSGDSMIDAAICDGDIVTVRHHGDIVASSGVNRRAA
ncbi:LexA family protein, partial [Streptomyces bottropensis]|uniref:LexA family protein n=1 Tax=Streptomyces bottropensis TaxID=42235 RepID=UPI0036CF56DA